MKRVKTRQKSQKNVVIEVCAGCVGVAIIVAFVVNLLFKCHLGGLFEFEDKAGPAIGYAGAVFGGVGTIVLGWVAYKQNEKLQAMENNNYIAANSSMILVSKVFVGKKRIPVNYDIHCEQILEEVCTESSPYEGYRFTMDASRLGNAIPSLIHINDCVLSLCDKENNIKCRISTKSQNEAFSRISIFKDKLKFSMTILFSQKGIQRFEDILKGNIYNLVVEFNFCIITDKYIATQCKCRSLCKYSNIAGTITWEDADPKVFFYGHEIMDKATIKIAGEKDDGQP